MLFEFNQAKDLSTPPIHFGGVDKKNPLFTSSGLFPFDDIDGYFSSNSPKKEETELVAKDNINENIDNHQQHQDDLFSTFDFPVLTDLDKTELPIDVLQFNKYLSETSFPSPTSDVYDPSICEESTYISMDDSTSAAFTWVGGECVVESQNTEDMMVPSVSSTSSTASGSRSKTKKKSSLSTIERKLRKKDQNKTAAEKYRIKKRAERDELVTRHTDLKNQNRELKFELENASFQLEQLKQLFVDVLQIPIPSNK